MSLSLSPPLVLWGRVRVGVPRAWADHVERGVSHVHPSLLSSLPCTFGARATEGFQFHPRRGHSARDPRRRIACLWHRCLLGPISPRNLPDPLHAPPSV